MLRDNFRVLGVDGHLRDHETLADIRSSVDVGLVLFLIERGLGTRRTITLINAGVIPSNRRGVGRRC